MTDNPSRLTHLTPQGAMHMVDVGGKPITAREAVAEGFLYAREDVRQALLGGGVAKGDAPAAARLAGILAAKRTADLIPLCHPLALDRVEVDVTDAPAEGAVRVEVRVAVTARTGAEMEALTAAAVALLTLYDMGKALQKDMVIGGVALLRKTGGQRGDFCRE